MPVCSPRRRRSAFSLIELLVSISLIALLIAILLPALSAARNQGRSTVCLSNLGQLGKAFLMYAGDYNDRCMPLAYWSEETIGSGPVLYWWGTNDPQGVDHTRGFVWPYLASTLGERTVFECPLQPPDSYRPQGAARGITSTYGYNGYYLSPPQTPGWAFQIGHRPWLDLGHVIDSARVFAFADTLIDLGGQQPFNTALLDPPRLYAGGSWSTNANPTTAFRHANGAQAVHVDGHAERYLVQTGWLKSPRFAIGSIETDNAPHYVPDWRGWREPLR